MSEESISDTPTGSSEDSKSIETPQIPTVLIKSTHDNADSPTFMLTSEVEPTQENGEHDIAKENKLLCTNLTVEMENRKVEGLITYSLDQQIFKFKGQFWKQKNPKKPLLPTN